MIGVFVILKTRKEVNKTLDLNSKKIWNKLKNERLLKQLQEIKNKSNTYIDIGNYVDYLSNNALEEYRNAYKDIGIESEK